MGAIDWLRKRNSSDPTGLRVLHHADDGPEPPAADIIFIHGITGGALRSWAADQSKPPWIQTLLPEQLPKARVLTFGYRADVVGGKARALTIRNHAEALIHDIDEETQGRPGEKRRPLIFVCHSFGGLVLQKALILANEHANPAIKAIFRRTHGIAFFGTPMRGSSSAEFADFLISICSIAPGPTNRALVDVCKESSEELYQIRLSFHKLLEHRRPEGSDPLQIVCYFEDIAMRGIGVIVKETSATLEDSLYARRCVDANHVDMVRFSSPDDPGFKALLSRLQRWMGEIPSSTTVDSNGFSAEQHFGRGSAHLASFSACRTGTVTGSAPLHDAIYCFEHAARLAHAAKPKDSVTYARSHLGIARCQRMLSYRESTWAEKRASLREARGHLKKAYEEALTAGSAPFKLRVEMELAVVEARQVQVDAEESSCMSVELLVTERKGAVRELERVIVLCRDAGRQDLEEYGGKWLAKIGSGE